MNRRSREGAWILDRAWTLGRAWNVGWGLGSWMGLEVLDGAWDIQLVA